MCGIPPFVQLDSLLDTHSLRIMPNGQRVLTMEVLLTLFLCECMCVYVCMCICACVLVCVSVLCVICPGFCGVHSLLGGCDICFWVVNVYTWRPEVMLGFPWWSSIFFFKAGASLNLELTGVARLAGGWALSINLCTLHLWSYRWEVLCLGSFIWVLGIWNQVILAKWQTLCWMGHLPAPQVCFDIWKALTSFER